MNNSFSEYHFNEKPYDSEHSILVGMFKESKTIDILSDHPKINTGYPAFDFNNKDSGDKERK